jgi:hypothetical protein
MAVAEHATRRPIHQIGPEDPPDPAAGGEATPAPDAGARAFEEDAWMVETLCIGEAR